MLAAYPKPFEEYDMALYRLRYSKILSGLDRSKGIYAIEFPADTLEERDRVAQSKWDDLVKKKVLGLEYIELIEVLDWSPRA